MIKTKGIIQKNISIITSYLRRLDKWLDKDEQSENIYGYEKLSPKADIKNKYFEEIDWAVENKDITNIALGGPYGAGKSSVIKAYMNKRKEYNYLNISLAYFSNTGEGKPDTNNIEENILKQMFYRVKHSKVPYSRYKRIKNIKPIVKVVFYLSFVFSILSGLIIFNPKFINVMIKTIKKLNLIDNNIKWGYISVTLFIITTSILLIAFIKFINRNIKLTKISTKISQSNIEFGSVDDDKSIFNKNIDEILYFFEVNKYDIVVFEDIDRFDNLDIFIKLRELNELINNCEQIKKQVTFIYAMKEDMFEDGKNRTKFFDFIIPIIPVINSSNSIEIMNKKLKKYNLHKCLDKNFINDVTIYIDDMRMLTNIYNEFRIYKSNLCNINLNMNNLFGIVVYKNIYPQDFAKLQFNKGMVAGIFNNKEYKNELIKEIDSEYIKINSYIEKSNKEYIKNMDELKCIYIDHLNINKYSTIYINGEACDYKSFKEKILVEDESLDKIIQYQEPNYGTRRITIKDILNANSEREDYYERLKSIRLKNSKNLEDLTKKLDELRKRKQQIHSMKVKDLIEEYGIENIINEETRKEKLIVYLVRNGYIDEMYNSYVTYFYEGSLTNEDMKFVQSIKNHEALPFSHKIQNVNKVMERLYISEFKRPEILNYDLLNFIISNLDKYRIYYDVIITQLSNEKEVSKDFIDKYISSNQNTNIFLNSISKIWTNIWIFIYKESNYTKEKIDEYLIKLIDSLEIEDLLNINKDNLLREYVFNEEFLSISKDALDNNKVKKLLKKLSGKFNYINIESVDKEMIDYIYNENLYFINKEIINLLIGFYNSDIDLKKLDTCNYTTIKESKCEKLLEYIKDNINLYITDVFLNLEKNSIESEESVIELLSDMNLSKELKYKIIEKENIQINDINKVDTDLWTILFEKSKIIVDWYNVAEYIDSEKFNDEVLVNYINNIENSKKLSEEVVDKDKYTLYKKDIYKIYKYIINNKNIRSKNFEIMVGNLKNLGTMFVDEKYFDEYISSNIDILEEDKIVILIELNLIELSKTNYDYLKEKFNGKHIEMIERNLEKFFDNYYDYSLNSKDVSKLLKSDLLSIKQKDYIIDHLKVEEILEDGIYEELVEDIGLYVLDKNNKISLSLLSYILNSNMSDFYKVLILSNQIKHLDLDYIRKALDKLGDEYSYLLNPGKIPLLHNNKSNERLVKELKNNGYISSWNIKDDEIKVNRKRSLATK